MNLILDFGDVLVTNLDACPAGTFDIHHELARVGPRKIRLAEEGKDQRQHQNDRAKDHGRSGLWPLKEAISHGFVKDQEPMEMFVEPRDKTLKVRDSPFVPSSFPVMINTDECRTVERHDCHRED